MRGVRLVILLFVLAVVVMASPASAATDFTWSGAGATGAGNWSNTANWVGAVAPSGAVGTLFFPALTAPACTANPATAACYTSTNDVVGLTATGISIDDGGHGTNGNAGYLITGNGITLGTGGITATPDPSDTCCGAADIQAPITLGANQTWTITGGSANQQLGIGGTVTGAGNTLGIAFSGNTYLGLNADTEVGAISASGSGVLVDGTSVNGTDGNPIQLSGGAGFVAFNSGTTSGPVTMSGGNIQVGSSGASPQGTLAVNGGVTLDSGSSLTLFVDQAGTTPGTDFSQLTASGNVALGGARLNVLEAGPTCPTLTLGDVLVLVSTTGSLSGTFGNAAEGAILPHGTSLPPCSSGGGEAFKIHYTANSVTATVVLAPPRQGQSADVAVLSGTVLVNGVPLTSAKQIPFGAVINTKHGVLAVTTMVGGTTETADISQGIVRLTQDAKTGLTTATLVHEHRSLCGTTSGVRMPDQARFFPRLLGWVLVRGVGHRRHHFRSRGHWASAGVGDPVWREADRCGGTYIHVYQGAITVHDFVRHTAIRLRAGKSYVARPR